VTPSISIRVTAYGSAGQIVESGVASVGLNRTAPTGTVGLSPVLTSAQVTTLSVPLVLTATDPTPDRGPIRVSLGSGDWIWEDGELTWTGGELVTDTAAGDGSAWHISTGTQGTLSGLGTGRLDAGHPYRAYFSIKVPPTVLTDGVELARLAVLADTGSAQELLGVRYVRGTDVKVAGVYGEFPVDLAGIPDRGDLVWQVDSFGVSELWVDRISVTAYLIDLVPTTTWTLVPREGPATLTTRFVDGAGNTSAVRTLALTVTDRSPPGAWRHLECSGLTCTVQVRDAIAGLNTDLAAVRVSADGGQSWSDWLPAVCSGEDGSHYWETLTAVIPVGRAAARTRQLQFRAYDRAAVPNVGKSSVYTRSWAFLPAVVRPVP
jgi:hypothetical protein